MNKYESIMILVPEIGEERKNEFLDKIKNIIIGYSTEEEKIEVEELGKRKLAYEVKRNNESYKEGFYVVITFSCNSEAISELERNYRITDEVIKFLTIRKDD